ncbi:MAG TPA: hypothetical protein VIS06_21835 [Mycobacteriales bacterium]
MPDVALFRSTSGQLIHLDLPLPGVMADQVTKGYLVRVNADGTPYTGDADAGVPAAPTTRPPVGAPKADWVGWAVHNGATVDDAEASTKADLVEKYGRDPAPPVDPTGGS